MLGPGLLFLRDLPIPRVILEQTFVRGLLEVQLSTSLRILVVDRKNIPPKPITPSRSSQPALSILTSRLGNLFGMAPPRSP